MSDTKNPKDAVPDSVEDSKENKILLPLPPIVLTPLIPQTVSLIARRDSQKVLNPNSAEQMRQFKLKLREQYNCLIAIFKNVGFLNANGETKEGDVPFPDFEEVISSFSEQSLMIASAYHQPTLVLDPDKSSSDPHKITSWRISIAEGSFSIGENTH